DELIVDFFRHNKTLGRDAGLAGILDARGYAGLERGFQICARHEEERIASAQLQDALFDLARSSAGDLAPCAFAARERDRFNSRVVNQAADCVCLDQQSLEDA